MKVLVTGAAGFIGMHTAKALLEQGHEVVGLDNLNDYYDPALKQARLAQLQPYNQFRFVQLDLADRDGMAALFACEQFQRVVHLAAQAGVRYSLQNPMAYVDSNLVGMMTILEGCRHHKVEHLVYASSSSVYGNQHKVPFSETDPVDTPISLYAASKKANELMAHTYSHLYQLPTTGLRFFTVYGPWGRPDMAPWLFTEAISQGKPIKVFNHGDLMRDFTYIDDIVEGVVRTADAVPTSSAEQPVPYRLYNIGNHQPVQLESFIQTIEQALNTTADKTYLPMQPGDVYQTYADVAALSSATGFSPKTPLAEGIGHFVAWYQAYTTGYYKHV
ncbi:NAD-dependent epimerase [Alkalimonas mucilaginosa]|uniref:NAD-dependent epimerase n=1 Tax=Alkalimonas mucilaginosa TaxID=3057676 RepID=A0ABU7JFL5_9GAMM|nr:NAD-dependent epimerase [Alkalimonas sp. MEB004]MEE2024482.1 NAD-dependent epimerase [Alkalimonas sp. MEB004]